MDLGVSFWHGLQDFAASDIRFFVLGGSRNGAAILRKLCRFSALV